MNDHLRSVSELARLSGVTVRTLHHYDEIGLLVPTDRSRAGYRLYDDSDVQRLAQIVAYRATGMSLTDIDTVLSTDGEVRAGHLRRQIELLDERRELLARQRQVLIKALEAMGMGINLDPEEIFEVFGEDDPRRVRGGGSGALGGDGRLRRVVATDVLVHEGGLAARAGGRRGGRGGLHRLQGGRSVA